MALMEAKETATTEELAHFLKVSEMTVRRDLDYFQREGKLQRCHGGAVLVQRTVGEAAYEQKMAKDMEAKRRLADIAASLVKPGMTVYLDAGTTTYCLAEAIAQMEGLMVITNDLKIALRLLASPAEIVVLGGQVQKGTGSMLGDVALEQLGQLRPAIAFLGSASIDARLYNLTPTQEKAFLKQAVRSVAQSCYLIADASKFHSSALYAIDSLSVYDGVITDAVLSESEKRLLGKRTRLMTP